ncbi:sugar kinase [Roseibium sediminis]|uniref:sugar kinase n=1 Tax=Roseibium sediminis TaxID=1775174 RepID=UPI00123D70CA|nr:sugar kinase [Roseibium sediminis]
MTDTPIVTTAGEILVEFVSHKKNCGLSKVAPYSGPYPSGAPAIFLDQAARMGAQTRMFGGVGDDGFGRSVLNRLQADGVDTTGVTITSGLSTGAAFVSYYDDGRRDFIFHLTNTAADHFATPDRLPDARRTWLHVSAASLGNAALRDAIMAMVAQVDVAGGRITCDPNARSELMRDPVASEALRNVMTRAHVLLPSTSDLDFLFPGVPEAEAVDRMLAAKAEIIALKRGDEGATVIHGGLRHDLPGHKVEEVDPTGAGDCFCGTFVALLAQGVAVLQAATRANAAGAIAVTRHGPMEGNSTPDEINEFLNR